MILKRTNLRLPHTYYVIWVNVCLLKTFVLTGSGIIIAFLLGDCQTNTRQSEEVAAGPCTKQGTVVFAECFP